MTWKIIGKTKWGEPVLQNEYGYILEGGCGNAPDGHQRGASMKRTLNTNAAQAVAQE